MMINGAFNAGRIIEFFETLICETVEKAFLILDRLPTHCRPVRQWLERNSTEMEVFCLPRYSPELNPDERLNADLKNALRESTLREKAPVRTEKELRESASSHMRIIEGDPERVKAYFNDSNVSYAR